MPYTPGSTHGASIKNPEPYNAMRRKGMSKAQAAAISNAQLKKTGKKGRHRRRRGK